MDGNVGCIKVKSFGAGKSDHAQRVSWKTFSHTFSCRNCPASILDGHALMRSSHSLFVLFSNSSIALLNSLTRCPTLRLISSRTSGGMTVGSKLVSLISFPFPCPLFSSLGDGRRSIGEGDGSVPVYAAYVRPRSSKASRRAMRSGTA